MTEATIYYASTATGLAALAMMSLIALRGWRDWIGLKRFELEHAHDGPRSDSGADIGSRIELADLRERLKKLEAIAAGVDL
jgi:hypothetical protein